MRAHLPRHAAQDDERRSCGCGTTTSTRRRRRTGRGIVGWYVVRVANPDEALPWRRRSTQEFAQLGLGDAHADRVGVRRVVREADGQHRVPACSRSAGVVFFTLLLVTGNTMAIAVRERTGELAVLKAIGFSGTASCSALVLAESLLIAVTGGAVGAVARAWRHAAGHHERSAACCISAAGRARRGRRRSPLGDRAARRGPAGDRRDAAERRRRAAEDLTMAIPLVYNMRSATARWSTSSVVAVARDRRARWRSSSRCWRSPAASRRRWSRRACRRTPSCSSRGADSEMTSVIPLDAVRIVEDAPQVARARGRSARERRGRCHRRPAAARGRRRCERAGARRVGRACSRCATTCASREGRFLRPGLHEVVIGRNAAQAPITGLDLGRVGADRPGDVDVVGVFDASGSAFDSEIWADADCAERQLPAAAGRVPVAHRPPALAADFPAFKATLERDPRVHLQAVREAEYYEAQSTIVTTLITVLGGARGDRHGARRRVRRAEHDVLGGRRSARARSRCCGRSGSAAAASCSSFVIESM